MNRQEIINMVAGKEINRKIAKEIFKRQIHEDKSLNLCKIYSNGDGWWTSILDYSNSMDNAMLIVELLRKSGIYLTITMDNKIYSISSYSTECEEDIEALRGESLPLLICKIALLCNMYDFVTLEV